MNWEVYIRGFKSFLRLEKSVSPNTIEAYIRDLERLMLFLDEAGYNKLTPEKLTLSHFEEFIGWLGKKAITLPPKAGQFQGYVLL